MKQMLERYRARKAVRRTRLAEEPPEWSPRPIRPEQRIRQAWCFLTRHNMEMSTGVSEDAGHTLTVETCIRCGLYITHCMECEMQGN